MSAAHPTKTPFKFLTEDEKMCKLIERLRSIDFGTIRVSKRHGKFVKITFEGEDLFLIPEHCKDKEGEDATR